MLSPAFTNYLNLQLSRFFGDELMISRVKPVGGGCINKAFCLISNKAKFFLKYNNATSYPGMFETEHKGLNLLHSTQSIHVPQPYFTGVFENNSFIIIEYIESTARQADFWEQFAGNIAAMHRNRAASYGLDYDNYIGSLKQENTLRADWVDFFINYRIEPQLNLAFNANLINKPLLSKFSALHKRLADIFPEEQPALLHGDLWSGNFTVNSRGEPSIFDPAVYYGHREMELAYTQLFGGFHSTFYSAYQQYYPVEKGFEKRKDYYNLYPLLVHVNLFGTSYLQQINSILRQF